MEKHNQQQKTDTAHCIRSRTQQQQQQEAEHVPDTSGKQIEEWMGKEGITMENLQQAYRNGNKQRGEETEQTIFDKDLAKLVEKGLKPEAKDDQKKHTATATGAKRRGNAYEKKSNSNKNSEKQQAPEKMTNSKTNWEK